MTILAIDQSYTSCGIVVLDGDTVIFAERYVSNAQDDMFARATQVAHRIKEVANEYKVEYIALEGLAFSKIGNATRDLAGLQFIIMYVMRFSEGYDVIVIPPNTVKKVATGKGNAKKEELLECLPKNALEEFTSLGVKKTTGLLDLTDAYWIGKAAQLEQK